REIVRRGYIKGIVGLPANLFYGTGIAACIVVLDKEGSADRRGVFLLDASRGFAKDGAKNRLRAQDIHKIVDTFTRQAEIPGYSRMVPLATIEGNDFNLNLSRYIDSLDAVDVQDIDAHLRGGIPQRDIEVLDRYWTVMPTLRENLIGDGPRPGYCSIRVAPDSVKDTIVEHPEFDLLAKTVVSLMDDWSSEVRPRLTGLSPDDVPKDLGEELSESILRRFARAQLLDPYDVYQRFMEYWASVMQDDVYLVVETGWKAAAAPRLMVDTRDQKSKEVPDYTVGKQRFKSDLIPASLLVALNFQTDRDALELLREAVSLAEIRLDDMAQEHATEGGILEGALDEKSNLTKRSVESRLRQVRREPDAADERAALEQYRDLLDKVAATKRRLKATSADLNEKVARAYAQLTDEDIAFIVVSEKWLASLAGDVYLELDRVSQMLASRLVELTERYAVTLPELAKASDELAGLVRRHLERMGATWQ
ncbi:MAG TPA: N-6 DNA methylase, partial [Coriobacteriia bacterium]|nr:N-6 DNA methylase [Coriobacteriia bacterium]